MIKELHLHNWKSFGDAKFYIDPLTAVIGTNASGKSNLLDALVFLQKLVSGIKIDELQENKDFRGSDRIINSNNPSCSLEIIVGYEIEKDISYKVTLEKKNSLLFLIETFSTIQDGNQIVQITHFSEGDSYIDTNYLPNTEKYNLIKKIVDKVHEVMAGLIFISPAPENMRKYVKVSKKLKPDASNIAGVLASLPEDRKSQIEQKLTEILGKIPDKDLVKVWAQKVGPIGSDAMLYCQEGWQGEEAEIIDAQTMSDGTLRFLAIVATLLLAKEHSLVLIEEVDNGLHPSRAEYLVKTLLELGQQRKIDIVFTTHNPALLDALGNEMIPFISVVHRNPNTGNSEITLLEELENLPKLMASGSIGKLVSQGKIESSLKHQLEK